MSLLKTTSYQEGDTDARICFVGEAPGGTEIAQARPLVGPSGRIFNECLHAAGIVRAESCIINFFDRRLTRDPLGKTVSDDMGDVIWTVRGGFTEAAEPYFERAFKRLSRTGANVFVPLGGLALEALTGKVGVQKWRGSILPSTLIASRKVIGSVHPAFILRGNEPYKYVFINDMEKVRRHSEFPELGLPKRNLIVEPSFDEAMAFLDSMHEGDYVATDIEIRNHQISCISFCNTPAEAISIPLMTYGERSFYGPTNETRLWLKMAEVLRNPDTMKVNQNILFDLHVLWYKNGIDYAGPLGDTMLAHHIIYPDLPKGLDFICSVCTDEPYYKDEGKIWNKAIKDWPEFYRYNAKDAAIALEAWLELEPLLDEEGYRASYDLHVNNFPWLLYVMDDGFQIDRERFSYVDSKVDGDLTRLQEEFSRRADYVFNWGSSAQCKRYFYEHKELKPYISGKTRKPTVDDKALARIARRYNLHEARIIQELRGLKKFKGSYLKLKFDSDGRFRCSLNPRGTKNGRLSSSKTIFGTGTNYQNLPERFQDFMSVDLED
jgi:uracil-DNA glycosylase